MGIIIDRDIFLSNANNIELQHIYSYSERHHFFHTMIMGIKYKASYIDGGVMDIEYHEDYIDCFQPFKKLTVVPENTSRLITTLIDVYITRNDWLHGWNQNWEKKCKKIWNSKMEKKPDSEYYTFKDTAESYSYFISRGNMVLQVVNQAV